MFFKVQKYKFLSHTGDVKFQAFGRTLEEAFSNAALATISLMWDNKKIEKRIKYRLEKQGIDLKQLLVVFLEEILFLMDSQMFLLHSAQKVRIEKKENQYLLEAFFSGDKYSDKYEIFGGVKAITYNEMRVECNSHFMVQVVVDV